MEFRHLCGVGLPLIVGIVKLLPEFRFEPFNIKNEI
jgi:hypothetical protein